MKAKILGRIKCFLKSEAGRVGLKTPLVLGVVSGSLLVAQAVLSPSAYSSHECYSNDHCSAGEVCKAVWNGESWVYKCVSS